MSEGEQKLNAVHNQGDKVIPQTATSGQASIRQELEALRQDWEGLGTQISDIEQNLVGSPAGFGHVRRLLWQPRPLAAWYWGWTEGPRAEVVSWG